MPPTRNVLLEEATSRDFSGGLNVADSELNLSSKYAIVLDNMINGIDGSNEVRQGNKLFADTASVSDYVNVDGHYFFNHVIVMNLRGELIAINGQGSPTVIWNAEIAAKKRAGLEIWPSATVPAFEEFNGELIVASKVHKPLVVTTALAVDYLQDKATGSNVNVPLGNVICGHARHFCIADGYMLHVSERDASGTWEGDAGATFVNSFDMRPYVKTGDTTIIGLHSFKNFLLVCFRELIVPIQFVEDGTATPKLNIAVAEESIISNYGAITQRSAQDIGDMILSADIAGVQSQSLSTFTKILSPDRPSRFVDPLLQPAINKLNSVTLEQDVFSSYDRRLAAYTLYMPNANGELRTGVRGFTYRYIKRLGLQAWSTISGVNWGATMLSSEGNVFLMRHNCTKIFVQGDAKTNPINRDFVGEQEAWDDWTVFTDRTGWTPITNVARSGMPIPFDWVLPWADLKHRGLVKTLKYVILDTQGKEQFTAQVFVDDIEQRASAGEAWSDLTLFDDNTGWTPESESLLTPALQWDLIGRDALGYGLQPYGSSPYGGGNNTKLRTLTFTPTKFTSAKLRFFGQAWGPLKFVAITLLYHLGSIRRLP